MDAERLAELGLTKREAHAYIALLRMEEAKAGEIAKASGEDRTNVYDSLNGLVKKGLVNYKMRGSVTYYRIAPPEKLRDFIDEKETALEEMLPELNKIYKSYKPKPVVETYEGTEGIKTVLKDLLREGRSFVGFGATDRLYKLVPGFAKMYLREREKRGIGARQFHTRGEAVLPSKLSKFKAVPREFSGPATTLIYGDKVAILLWFIDPPVAVLIKSKEAAEAYRMQFEFMWKIVR